MSIEFRGKVRATDGEGSWSGAALQTDARVSAVQAGILRVFAEHGPLTDEAMCESYGRLRAFDPTVPRSSDQGLRTRRHDLVVKGLVRDARRFGLTALGNRATLWELRR